MALGGDRNGSGEPDDPRLSDDPLRRGSRGWANTGLLGSRARDSLRGPSGRGDPHQHRTRWRTLGLLAVLVLVVTVALHRHPSTCVVQTPPNLTRSDVRFWVAYAVAGVPCPSTGRAVTGLRDSAGAPMTGLDPISVPGGYLGVYDPSPARMALARSGDLTTWRRVRGLGAGDAPALQPIPGTSGYLLAYTQTRGARQGIRVSYFRSLSALLAAHEATSIDLPLRLSATANAAPWFVSVSWNGSLRRSQMTIAFDYASAGSVGRPGPDREALGVLRGFRSWSAAPDTRLDQLIDRRGLTGNHGQGRRFVIAGRPWAIYSAQDAAGSHIVLDDVQAGDVLALKLLTPEGTLATSFGRPVASVLPTPTGTGQALVVCLYVYDSANTRTEAGELLYWTPINQ